MKTIHKHPLPPEEGPITISMHQDARPLSVDLQYGWPHLWCEEDTDKPRVKRTFYVCGTGLPMPEDITLTYIGTVVCDIEGQGMRVWHVWAVED